MNYTIEYGRLAAAFLIGTEVAFEEQLRGELNELLELDPKQVLPDFIFIYSIEYNDRLFIVKPIADDKVRVVSATLEEGPILDKGPFAGKKIMWPVADED